MPRIYFEDIDEGEQAILGTEEVDREEMVTFARQYDPLPIHTDPEFAAESIHGGLIASGWFTVGLCMRKFVRTFLVDAAAMGGFGAELTWPNPVRPDDTLTIHYEILEAVESESRDDRGYVTHLVTAENQRDETVLTWEGTGVFLKRNAREQ